MPATTDKSVRLTRYNAMGWKERESSWVYDNDGQVADETILKAKSWEDYDPFGRPARVKQADDSVTSFWYEGVRWVGTDQNVALAITGGESCVRRWDRFDRRGRLHKVEEAYSTCLEGGQVGQVTEYQYDEADRLAKVCQNGDCGSSGQVRVFNYDNRGFLTSEQHPEKGPSGGPNPGNGLVTYSCFDARGHNRYRDDGSTARRLVYTFDRAERLTRVQAPAGTETCFNQLESGTAWKLFTYATANNTTSDGLINARKGKLETAMSRNEIGAPPSSASVVANVTESYTYQDRGGRAKKRVTSVSGTSGIVTPESWQVSQTTNSLGLLETQDYPTCIPDTGCMGAPGPISTTMGYEDGMLQTVTAGVSATLLSGISYHPSGMPAVVWHGPSGNASLTETIVQAGHGMPRPESLTVTSRDGSSFTTGTYSYDGAGNIKSMGNATIGTDRFRYDRFSRLAEAQMGTLGSAVSQIATFDAYGSITAMNTNGTGMNFPTSGATNRLASATYDEAGNILLWNANSYSWDRFNRMIRWSNGSENWSYVYSADDERLWAIKGSPTEGNSTWTLRGFDNAVLGRDQRQASSATAQSPGLVLSTCPSGTPASRVFCDNFESGNADAWEVVGGGPQRNHTRYAYRDGRLLLSLDTLSGFRDFGLDHLGSVRVATDDVTGTIAARHTYFPFGQEATSTSQDDEVMKFTGHERDLQSTPTDPADDLDYMHARYRSPLTGRFLSPDLASGAPAAPQTWNRYTYARGNPLSRVDRNGYWDNSEFGLNRRMIAKNGGPKWGSTPEDKRIRAWSLGPLVLLFSPVATLGASPGVAGGMVLGGIGGSISGAISNRSNPMQGAIIGNGVGTLGGAITGGLLMTPLKQLAASAANDVLAGEEVDEKAATAATATGVPLGVLDALAAWTKNPALTWSTRLIDALLGVELAVGLAADEKDEEAPRCTGQESEQEGCKP